MGTLPATGTEISMGAVYKAYTNSAPSAGSNIGLNAELGVNQAGIVGAGAETEFSTDFGGLNTPYDYIAP
jgi:hypothetical protein